MPNGVAIQSHFIFREDVHVTVICSGQILEKEENASLTFFALRGLHCSSYFLSR